MMNSEKLIPFNSVPAFIARRDGGRKINLSTLYRWRSSGLCGVRLEYCFVAGKPFTSVEALQRFDEAVTAAKCASTINQHDATEKQTQKAHERAMKKLGKVS